MGTYVGATGGPIRMSRGVDAHDRHRLPIYPIYNEIEKPTADPATALLRLRRLFGGRSLDDRDVREPEPMGFLGERECISVISGARLIAQKHQIAALMDSLAPHYGDDFWFLSYHAMGLSEDGQLAMARAKIEQSLAANPNNAHGAHGFAHVCYESGELAAAGTFLSSWLATYPRDGFFYGHLSWHLSLCEIQAGNWVQALRLYRDALTLERHSGGPQLKMSDGAAFLWRSELAGQPRDEAAWRALYGYANSALPRPGNALADLHVILAQAVMGDDAALDVRARQMEELAREGRYPSGSYLPALARGFAAFEHGDFSAAIEALAPLAEENERIGGSRAQHDLIEFTLLRAYLSADRLEEARRLISARRPGASGIPVTGAAAVH